MSASGLRPIVRLAHRSLLRDRWRTALVIVLIAIPVFAMSAAALILETVAPTAEERATSLMGRADLMVYPVEAADATALVAALPPGAKVEAISSAQDDVLVPGTTVGTSVAFLDLDGLASGKLVVTDGHAPTAPDEVAVSADLAKETGAAIGDQLAFRALGTVRIVGMVEAPETIHWRAALADPSRGPADGTVWLVGLPPGTSRDDAASAVRDARPPGATPDESAPLYGVLTRGQGGEASETLVAFAFVLGALALIEAALIASAAFAVGIRRRQRELGLLGAVGGTPRQMAAAVLAEGAIAGGIAAVLGIILGVAASLATRPFFDGLTGRRVGPLEIDPIAIAIAMLIGLGAALIAAGVPAWGAARLPTLVALSGRRPPTTPARRLLSVGLVLVTVALLCTVVAPIVARLSESVMPLLFLLVGAVTGVIGFGACSPWLLERLEGPARRLPLAARIAIRDTSRARTRNGPIVTAVLASVAGMIALSALLASQSAMSAERWRPPIPADVLIVGGSEAATVGPRVAEALGAIGWGPLTGISAPGAAPPSNLDNARMTFPLASPNTRDEIYGTSIDWFVIGDESMLRALGGVSATDAFRDGAVVGFPWQEVRPQVRGTLELLKESYDGVVASFVVPLTLVPGGEGRSGLPDGLIPVATARSLGLAPDPAPDRYLVRLERTVTQDDVDLAARIAASDASTYVTAALRLDDPMAGFRMVMLVASLVVALSVTSVAVALGETESRGDLRTLLALGADRRLRRRITAARGAVLAILAGTLAVPAGLLPVWGVLFPRGWPIVVPLPEVVGAMVILPLMAVAGGLVLGRPMNEWATRRDLPG